MPFNQRRGCGRAVCRSPRPIIEPVNRLRYWAVSGGTLAIVGEHVSVLQVEGSGRVTLLRAASRGTSRAQRTRQRGCTTSRLSGPTGTLHAGSPGRWRAARAATCPTTGPPGEASAPWKRAPTLSKLAAEVEAALVREARLPTKQIIPMPQGSQGSTQNILDGINDEQGRIILPTTTAGGHGAGSHVSTASPTGKFRG